MSKKHWSLFSFLIFLGLFSSGKVDPFVANEDPLLAEDRISQENWVDSVFHSLSFEDRLGQLIMVAAYSNKDQRHVDVQADRAQSKLRCLHPRCRGRSVWPWHSPRHRRALPAHVRTGHWLEHAVAVRLGRYGSALEGDRLQR